MAYNKLNKFYRHFILTQIHRPEVLRELAAGALPEVAETAREVEEEALKQQPFGMGGRAQVQCVHCTRYKSLETHHMVPELRGLCTNTLKQITHLYTLNMTHSTAGYSPTLDTNGI